MILALLSACSAPPQPAATAPIPTPPPSFPRPPAADSPLEIVFAGAPTQLFGPYDSPDFEGPFQTMADAGVDTFFPLFITAEVAGVATTTGHITHFLTPELYGAGDDFTCRGATDPYDAAEGRIGILFQGAFLLGDPLLPLDQGFLRYALRIQHDDCWADHPGVVTGFDTYDEPALHNAVADFLGDDPIVIGNIAVARDIVLEEVGLPTVLIEGPGPYVFPTAGLADQDLTNALNVFWADLDEATENVDAFGFDIYPVPDGDLGLPGDYVLDARELAPTSRAISVIQGFGYGQTTGGTVPGRTPTLDETRFMAFDSIAAGADTVVWYGQSALVLENADEAELWEALLMVSAELATVRDFVTGTPVLGSEAAGFRMRAHQTSTGDTTVLVTRTTGSPGEICVPHVGTASSQIGPAPSLAAGEACVALDAWGVSVFSLE